MLEKTSGSTTYIKNIFWRGVFVESVFKNGCYFRPNKSFSSFSKLLCKLRILCHDVEVRIFLFSITKNDFVNKLFILSPIFDNLDTQEESSVSIKYGIENESCFLTNFYETRCLFSEDNTFLGITLNNNICKY